MAIGGGRRPFHTVKFIGNKTGKNVIKQGKIRENTGNFIFEILWVPCHCLLISLTSRKRALDRTQHSS